jgi:hypothetical protein
LERIRIKDIYAGKPDAKDEIQFDGFNDFIKAFIIPYNCNIEHLIYNHHCFITGYKGTGKTSLLFYIDNQIRQKDENACSSYIFFKENFSDIKKDEIEYFSKRLLSSITVDKTSLIEINDFEYIWRWLFFKKLISDNKDFNENLFVNDDAWNNFEKVISKIKEPANFKKGIITTKFKLGIPISDPVTGISVNNDFEVDIQNKDFTIFQFTSLIDQAEEILKNVKRTDIPYHIYVDELEAYYGDKEVFCRDLYLIRDLLITVKRLNKIFLGTKNTKIICCVRSEIINAISKFIVTKELNKVISGFDVPLKWDYNNTNSFSHPIMQILIRRIELSEKNKVTELDTSKSIVERWFNEKIHDIEPSNYILNNSWCKPRDIVRFIISAQNCIHNDKSTFSQAVFDSLQKQYSLDSLLEIKEEMRALYSTEEITQIINCFTGFRAVFSVKQMKDRIAKYFPESILAKNFNQVMEDLYRLGFIGNYSPLSQQYRWHHKGEDQFILSDEWRVMVHHALQSALSISKKQDYSFNRKSTPETGDIVDVIVTNIRKSFLKVSFDYYGKKYIGKVHISELTGDYVKDIYSIARVGEEFKAKILYYNKKQDICNLSFRLSDPV